MTVLALIGLGGWIGWYVEHQRHGETRRSLRNADRLANFKAGRPIDGPSAAFPHPPAPVPARRQPKETQP